MLQPPDDFEEFLKSQKLEDWPETFHSEDSASLLVKLGHCYAFDTLAEYFYKNVPLNHEVLTDMEMKIDENASLLEKYFPQTFYPSRTDTEIGEPTDISSELRMTRRKKFDIKQTERKTDITEIKVYADCLSQAVFAVFFGAFPKSHLDFDDKFKDELTDLIFQWVSGIKPLPLSWKKWNLDFNDLIKMNNINEFLIPGKVTGTAGRCQLDFNMDELIQDAKEMCMAKLSTEEMKEIKSMEDAPTKTSAVTESHSIGPGPRFCRVFFRLGGQSPLISHYLKMHEIANVTSTLSYKLQRTELCKLPPVASTYQDVIKEVQISRTNVQMDYNSRMKTSIPDNLLQSKVLLNKLKDATFFRKILKEVTIDPEDTDEEFS
ncbi:protein FAM227B [Rhinatrema bivittatum]|uniref:protein FAM227B n=1 Tax=Rhinatrema bivittatum TaxID=194408 RepID=UPI00112C1385|nr:protein FAM227B [Rhinatrema bivittatum]